MNFVPAGELIGAAHRVRAVTLADSDRLPDGDYRFIDMYCTDPSCDCRKTMINVYHNGVLASTINFGWESRDFYLNARFKAHYAAVKHQLAKAEDNDGGRTI